MNGMNCFEVLQISGDATLEEARESYRRLIKLWHPDQYGNFPEKQKIAHEKLKEINVAYRDIAATFKNRADETDASFAGKDLATTHETASPERKKNRVAALWNRVSQLVQSGLLKSKHAEDPERDGSLSSGAARHRTVSFGAGAGRTAPDFQQALKKAVGERQSRGGRRQGNGSNRRLRGQFGNAASYRAGTTGRRRHGDRVEKISPVGRVNRIGGE